jgi:hypothetical protein
MENRCPASGMVGEACRLGDDLEATAIKELGTALACGEKHLRGIGLQGGWPRSEGGPGHRRGTVCGEEDTWRWAPMLEIEVLGEASPLQIENREEGAATRGCVHRKP